MYGGEKEILSISMADNGFIIKMKDIAAEKKAKVERKKDKPDYSITNPDPKVIVAGTTAALIKILTDKLPKIVSASEQFDQAFDEATSAAVPTRF